MRRVLRPIEDLFPFRRFLVPTQVLRHRLDLHSSPNVLLFLNVNRPLRADKSAWTCYRTTIGTDFPTSSVSRYPRTDCVVDGALKPPVVCATGNVPYRMEYNWFKPHGSNREGIKKMSTPAVILCAMGMENPTHPRNRSGYCPSAHFIHSSNSVKPEPSMMT